MTDKQLIASWRRIKRPEKALEVILANWGFIGSDPYYRDLNDELYKLAERALEKIA